MPWRSNSASQRGFFLLETADLALDVVPIEHGRRLLGAEHRRPAPCLKRPHPGDGLADVVLAAHGDEAHRAGRARRTGLAGSRSPAALGTAPSAPSGRRRRWGSSSAPSARAGIRRRSRPPTAASASPPGRAGSTPPACPRGACSRASRRAASFPSAAGSRSCRRPAARRAGRTRKRTYPGSA